MSRVLENTVPEVRSSCFLLAILFYGLRKDIGILHLGWPQHPHFMEIHWVYVPHGLALFLVFHKIGLGHRPLSVAKSSFKCLVVSDPSLQVL